MHAKVLGCLVLLSLAAASASAAEKVVDETQTIPLDGTLEVELCGFSGEATVSGTLTTHLMLWDNGRGRLTGALDAALHDGATQVLEVRGAGQGNQAPGEGPLAAHLRVDATCVADGSTHARCRLVLVERDGEVVVDHGAGTCPFLGEEGEGGEDAPGPGVLLLLGGVALLALRLRRRA